jgi:hypothetical protein
MASSHRPYVVLLAATLAVSPGIGEAKRHGHGHGHGHSGRGHHGWMQGRVAKLRGWFRRVAHEASHRAARAELDRSALAARRRAADEAALAARRRTDVDAYLRDHPVFAAAE